MQHILNNWNKDKLWNVKTNKNSKLFIKTNWKKLRRCFRNHRNVRDDRNSNNNRSGKDKKSWNENYVKKYNNKINVWQNYISRHRKTWKFYSKVSQLSALWPAFNQIYEQSSIFFCKTPSSLLLKSAIIMK